MRDIEVIMQERDAILHNMDNTLCFMKICVICMGIVLVFMSINVIVKISREAKKQRKIDNA